MIKPTPRLTLTAINSGISGFDYVLWSAPLYTLPVELGQGGAPPRSTVADASQNMQLEAVILVTSDKRSNGGVWLALAKLGAELWPNDITNKTIVMESGLIITVLTRKFEGNSSVIDRKTYYAADNAAEQRHKAAVDLAARVGEVLLHHHHGNTDSSFAIDPNVQATADGGSRRNFMFGGIGSTLPAGTPFGRMGPFALRVAEGSLPRGDSEFGS